jgi:hypothetical protein
MMSTGVGHADVATMPLKRRRQTIQRGVFAWNFSTGSTGAGLGRRLDRHHVVPLPDPSAVVTTADTARPKMRIFSARGRGRAHLLGQLGRWRGGGGLRLAECSPHLIYRLRGSPLDRRRATAMPSLILHPNSSTRLRPVSLCDRSWSSTSRRPQLGHQCYDRKSSDAAIEFDNPR